MTRRFYPINWPSPVLFLIVIMSFVTAVRADFHVIYSFPNAGRCTEPGGALILSGKTLYGVSARCAFKVNIDGTGFNMLHYFSGAADGMGPCGPLILSGSFLYGMSQGGALFKLGTDGEHFDVLHALDNPIGTPLLSGSTLYGMEDGHHAAGSIFKIGIDGKGYTTLYQFGGRGKSNGGSPSGSLIMSGTTLYGATNAGGDFDRGIIFSIETDGSGFKVLYSFTGGDDGFCPHGPLVCSGSMLYGITSVQYGIKGTLFQIGTDGAGFKTLHTFGTDHDDIDPVGSLILSGSTLYGMTQTGGPQHDGTIFQIGTDGSGFKILRSFTDMPRHGSRPIGTLFLSGLTLYGITQNGGAPGCNGTIFGLTIPAISGSNTAPVSKGNISPTSAPSRAP